MSDPSGAFSQFPEGGPDRPTSRSRGSRFGLFWLMAVAVPAAAALAEGSSLLIVALVSAVVAALVVAIDANLAPWWAWVPVAAALAVALAASTGWAVAAAWLIGVAVSAWVSGAAPVLPITPIDPDAVPQILGLALLAAVVVWRLPDAAVGAAIALAIAVLIISQRPAAAARLRRVVGRVADRVAAALVAVIFGLIGLVVVGLPWLIHRAARWNPIWLPRRRGTRWVEVRSPAGEGVDLWGSDRRVRRTTAGRRLHRTAMVAAVLVVALLGVGLTMGAQQARYDREVYSAPALDGSPWWPAMSDAINIAYGRSPISSYAGVMLADARYPGFNVTDGRRHTWRAPSGDCPTVRVWMFGGSTTFGLGQRDEHTIASELARLAWSEGVPTEVENWGVPADMSWMETRRLELALADGHPTPDVAIFYDGANDYRVQAALNSEGDGGELIFANDLDHHVFPGIVARNSRLARLMEIVRDGPVMPTTPTRNLSPAEIGAFAARGYGETDRFTQTLLDDRGIQGFRFYQPTRFTRRPALETEQPTDPGNENFQAEVERAFRDDLPPGVVDLSGVMDGDSRPVYYDDLHTNELGARLVAEAIWEQVGDAVRSQAADLPQGDCG